MEMGCHVHMVVTCRGRRVTQLGDALGRQPSRRKRLRLLPAATPPVPPAGAHSWSPPSPGDSAQRWGRARLALSLSLLSPSLHLSLLTPPAKAQARSQRDARVPVRRASYVVKRGAGRLSEGAAFGPSLAWWVPRTLCGTSLKPPDRPSSPQKGGAAQSPLHSLPQRQAHWTPFPTPHPPTSEASLRFSPTRVDTPG